MRADNGSGGAIENAVSVTITASTLSRNTATFGGAIDNRYGMLSATASTFSGNSADNGGAICNGCGSNSGAVSATASTFSGNTAAFGGAIFNNSGVSITASTFSGNAATARSAAGGAIAGFGTTTIGSTILASSPSGGACSNFGTITDTGYNLEDTYPSTCSFSPANHDVIGQDPKLGALANNGGPTQTIALESGSPAIDQIPVSGGLCPPTDQRGFARPDDNETSCDIGAYESAPPRSTIRPHGVRVVAFQNTGCTTTALIASVNPAGSPGGAITFEDTRPTGAPCSHFKAGALYFRSLSIASVVCTSTTATVDGTARESVYPSTTVSTVSFAASVKRLPMPGKPQNGTFQLYTSDGYTSGAIPSFTSILC